jgi:hypothetical protein
MEHAPEDGSNDGSDGDDNDISDNGTNDPGTDDNTTIDPIDQLDLKVGDFVEFTAHSELVGLTQTTVLRLTVSEADASGYQIALVVTSGSSRQESTFHANSTEDLVVGVSGESFAQGTLIGEETISTIYGDKQVEHWRSVTDASGATNVTDYYVGKSTGMVYKIVIKSTSNDLLRLTTTTTAAVSDTNIDKVKSGDPA